MARYFWNLTSGSAPINTGANWTNEADGSTGVVPTLTDTMLFNQNGTGGATAAGSIDLSTGAIEVSSGYAGPDAKIGDNGSPVNISAAEMSFAGDGVMYHTGTIAGKVSQKHNRGHLYLGGTYQDNLYLTRGLCTVQSNVVSTFNEIHVGFEGNPASDSTLVVEEDALAIALIVVAAGTAMIRRNVTDLINHANTTIDGDTIDTTRIHQAGGNLYRNAKGTDALINAIAGLLSYERDTRPKTCTLLNQHPGCIVNTRNGAGSVDITRWVSVGQTTQILDGASGASAPIQS